jgi:hypothetical protein
MIAFSSFWRSGMMWKVQAGPWLHVACFSFEEWKYCKRTCVFWAWIPVTIRDLKQVSYHKVTKTERQNRIELDGSVGSKVNNI